jgi:hypothetical protein
VARLARTCMQQLVSYHTVEVHLSCTKKPAGLLYTIWQLLQWSLASTVVNMYMEPHAAMSRTAELCIPLHAAAAQDVLMYVEASIWSGSGLMSTSNRSCTSPGTPRSA